MADLNDNQAQEREAWISRAIAMGIQENEARATAARMSEFAPKESGLVTKAQLMEALHVDYSKDTTPEWVRDVIDESFAIEREDARSAGQLGFMTRALVSATMPYKDPKSKVFERRNGDMTLTILSPNGVPFGKYPRLFMSYLVTEAVAKRSSVVELGDSLAQFMRNTLNVSSTGGTRGTATLVSEQMRRLFTSMVSVQQVSKADKRGFSFDNIMLVKRGNVSSQDAKRLDDLATAKPAASEDEAGKLWLESRQASWNSSIELTPQFFQECIDTPVPIDLRAYKVLSDAPMAMDIYAWLTYRASYVKKSTRPIPWVSLQAQFGSGMAFSDQGLRDFKKAFKRNLDVVRMVYPEINVDENGTASGLIIHPSSPHVHKLPNYTPKQPGLF
jgi:Plasmid encoded RepA protein